MKRFILIFVLFFGLFFSSKINTVRAAVCPAYDVNAPAVNQACLHESLANNSFLCGPGGTKNCTCGPANACDTSRGANTNAKIVDITFVTNRTCRGDCYGTGVADYEEGHKCFGAADTQTCYVCNGSSKLFEPKATSICGTPPVAITCKAWNPNDPQAGQDCSTYHDTTFDCGPSNLYRCTCGPINVCGSHAKVTSVVAKSTGLPPVTDPGTPPVGACDGCSDEGSCGANGKKGTFALATDTYHPECKAQRGYCSGTTYCGGGGTAPAPVTGNLVCGDACTSSSQCRNPSGNGSPVACINGTCQNTMCAEGMTVPGGNCSCGANTRKCGQSCSGTVGLCGPGQGTCTYVNPPSHWYTGQPDCAWGSAAYCVGTQNGFSRVQCTTGDAPGGGYARDPSGNVKTIDTSTLAPSCQVCGNGDVEVNEQCDDGKLNGTACGCSKTCEHFTMVLSANGTNDQVTVASGSNVTLDWKSAGMTSCVAQDGWTGEKALTGTETINNVVANTQYTLKCLQTGTSRPVYSSVVVNITGKTAAPVINFKINGSSAPVVYGKPVNWATQFGVFNAYFNWTTSGATSCVGTTNPSPQTVYPFPGGVPYKMSASVAGWFLFDQTQPVNLTSKTAALSVINDAGASKYGVFKFSCTGLGGTTTKTIVVVTDKTPAKQACAAPGTFITPPPTAAPLVCSMPVTITSTGNKDSWKIGDKITFSLPAVSASSIPSGATLRYEGEVKAYRGSTQILSKVLTPINATASQFTPIQISAVNATYYYHFRYCVKSSSGTETCSAWGEWTLPTPPPAKTVKLIKDGTTGWMDVDAINENGGLTQQTSSRFAYTGSWATDTNAVYNGGSSTYTGTAGATVTFSTTASSLKLMTTRASNRATFDVYVNGVKKTTVSTKNSTRQDQFVIDLTPYL